MHSDRPVAIAEEPGAYRPAEQLNPRQRAVCSILYDRRSAYSVSDLATELVAAEREVPLRAVTDAAYEKTLASLVHHHLPALAESGRIEWDREREMVTATPVDHTLAIRLETHPSHHLNRLFNVLTNSRRRTALSIVAGHDGPIGRKELARLVAAVELGCHPTRVSATETDQCHISLHHSHLPALSAVGVLEYDPETELIRYEGHPLLIDHSLSRP